MALPDLCKCGHWDIKHKLQTIEGTDHDLECGECEVDECKCSRFVNADSKPKRC